MTAPHVFVPTFRDEMVKTLTRLGVKPTSIAGDRIDNRALRTLLQKALGDDGQFVPVNYLRSAVGQKGGGHWSVCWRPMTHSPTGY